MVEYFKNEPLGTVVSMDIESGQNNYFIWFPYTKSYIKEIKVGSFVAVKNYNTESGKFVYSILEIISAYPKHYALGGTAETEKAFPGFVIEAAKNAKSDWEQEEPIEQTTKIKAEAISTGMQLTINGGTDLNISIDESLPMVGEEAHLLVDDVINKLINDKLLSTEIPTIEPCTLILNPNVKVKISTEDLLRTHFGIFGFTGAGKSNLTTNLVTDILNHNNKVVIFDLMSEYTGLLSHLIYEYEDSMILCDSINSIPGSNAVIEYMSGNEERLEIAAKSIADSLLLPKDIVHLKEKYVSLFKKILTDKKIKFFKKSDKELTSREVRAELKKYISGKAGNFKTHLENVVEIFFGKEHEDKKLNREDYKRFVEEMKDSISSSKIIDTDKPASNITNYKGEKSLQYSYLTNVNESAKESMRNMKKYCESFLSNDEDKVSKIKEEFVVDFNHLYQITSSDKPSLVIVQSNNDDSLREFSAEVIFRTFDRRKHEGLISPTVVYMFDEADEFMPQGKNGDSYGASIGACTLLARRGRKFGMGLGLATQRIAFLNTSILAQPHSFFVSKLPREYDRTAISNAFGTSSDMLDKTLNFRKGQWMLFSYDATGLTNVPIPVQFPNANTKVKEYLEKEF